MIRSVVGLDGIKNFHPQMYLIEQEMVETSTLLAGIEVIGAIGVILATFLVGGFSSDPLPWRVLAIFMIAGGLRRLR